MVALSRCTTEAVPPYGDCNMRDSQGAHPGDDWGCRRRSPRARRGDVPTPPQGSTRRASECSRHLPRRGDRCTVRTAHCLRWCRFSRAPFDYLVEASTGPRPLARSVTGGEARAYPGYVDARRTAIDAIDTLNARRWGAATHHVQPRGHGRGERMGARPRPRIRRPQVHSLCEEMEDCYGETAQTVNRQSASTAM